MTVYKSLPMAEIISGYKAGDSMGTLAKKYGVGYGTIRRSLAAANVPIRSCNDRSPHAETHTIATEYVTSLDASGRLHPSEVAKLRRAIGWRPHWTRPYDPVHGDSC